MITPVLLAGGSGTRLWPLSRKSYPKQFAQLLGRHSLLQDTALRFRRPGFAAPIVITAADFRFIVAEQLAEVGVTPAAIMIEPVPRSTAPAIAAAAIWSRTIDPDATLLVSPSDHDLPDADAFADVLKAAEPAVEAGQIVTVGITPTRPETGFGYLDLGGADGGTVAPVVRFVEKPDAETAAAFLGQPGMLWNAGVFLFRTETMIRAYERHAPSILSNAEASVHEAERDPDFVRLADAPWTRCDEISVDYAIMEKAPNVSAIRFDGAWSDVGGWEAVWQAAEQDAQGVAKFGRVTTIDCHNSLLRAEDPRVELVGIGLDDVVAIATPDAVLVSRRDRGEEVKQAVAMLKAKGARQAEAFPKDYRPWGWFESLVVGGRFQVKRICVDPGAKLSLQSHFHRSEHWIIVEGTALVTLDEDQHLLTENQSIYIPLGTRHRVENPGRVPMLMIEVQTGAYVGEDDIVRYEDIYARD